jgi:hypothetical protein
VTNFMGESIHTCEHTLRVPALHLDGELGGAAHERVESTAVPASPRLHDSFIADVAVCRKSPQPE